jgi:hypothetical protein
MCAAMKRVNRHSTHSQPESFKQHLGIIALAALCLAAGSARATEYYDWSAFAMTGVLNSGNFCTSDGTIINCSTPTVNLATQVAGTLGLAYGGTGASTASASMNSLLSSPLAGTYQLSCDGSGCTPISVAESSGIVNSGVQYQMAYYAATGTSVSGNPYIYTSATNDFIVSAGKIGIGTTTLGNTLTVAGSFGLVFGSDYSTTGTQSDVAINGSSAIRYTGAGTATFQGIVAGGNGQVLYLHNASSSVLTLANQSSSEDTAANRIITGTGSDIPVPADTSVSLQYDATAQRWRVTGSSNAAKALAAGSTTQFQYNDAGDMAGAPGLIYDKTNARTGVGSATPVTTLDVNGPVKMAGSGSETCDNNHIGMLRYNAVLRRMEVCYSQNPVSGFSVAFTTTPIGTGNQSAAAFQMSGAVVGDTYTYGITSTGGGGTISGSGTVSSSTQSVSGLDVSTLGDGSLTVAVTLTTPVGVTEGTALAMTAKATGVSGCSSPGDTCSDGSIYVGTDGLGALYATPCDQGMSGTHASCTGTRQQLTWDNGAGSSTITTARNTNDGRINTTILYDLGTSTSPAPYIAARSCRALGSNWYLPAKLEVLTLYNNMAAVGGFTGARYWSSTEFQGYELTAYTVNFGNGGSYDYPTKNSTYYVRCVHR